MKRAIIAVAFIYLAHSASLACPQVSPVSQAETPITIPFNRANNLIVITTTLNGQGPFRFALDTGSSAHVLNREIAGRLGLKIIGHAVADSGNNTTPAEVTEVSAMRIGALTLTNQRVLVTPWPTSYPFDGFLGADLFKQFVVMIDFARSVVTLTLPTQFSPPPTGELVPLKLRNGIPEIKAEIDGNTGWFKVDTGYNAHLALFAEFVAQHKKLANRSIYPSTNATGGQTIIGSVSNISIIQIGLLRIKTVSRAPRGRDGEIMVSNVPAALFTDKGGSNSAYAGAMGTLVLDNFKVTINYSQKMMILSQER